MSPLGQLAVTLVVLAILVGIIWLCCFLFLQLHEYVKDLVYDDDTYFLPRVIAGIIYVFTSIVMFFFGFLLTMAAGYAVYKGAEQTRDWWNKKD